MRCALALCEFLNGDRGAAVDTAWPHALGCEQPSNRRRLLELFAAVGHLGLEAGEDAAVHLAYPAFR